MAAGRRFWTGRDTYHELAKTYERHVEVTSPRDVSSFCGLHHCRWDATNVTYYEYTGPSV